MRKEIKKRCMICGDVFITTTSAAHQCPSCAEFRRKYRGYTADQKRRKKLKGNQAVIERVNIEAQQLGTTYGKLGGKRYAAEHVRVKIPMETKEGKI